jgi:hypothetical protein
LRELSRGIGMRAIREVSPIARLPASRLDDPSNDESSEERQRSCKAEDGRENQALNR